VATSVPTAPLANSSCWRRAVSLGFDLCRTVAVRACTRTTFAEEPEEKVDSVDGLVDERAASPSRAKVPRHLELL